VEEKTQTIAKLRDFSLKVLQRRFDRVIPIPRQGAKEGSFYELWKDGKKSVCAVKATSGGRICFPRKNNKWTPLYMTDFVVYARPSPKNANQIEMQFHSKSVIQEAFDANLRHAQSVGIDIIKLPAWLNADHESGDRFVGSGFGKSALWVEFGAFSEGSPKPAIISSLLIDETPKLTIDEAKRGIAASLGISPECVEIYVRA
jgi:hypothetical protein